MAGFKIDKRAIAKMQKEIVKEFERANRKHPVRIPIEVEPPSMGMLTLARCSPSPSPYTTRHSARSKATDTPATS